ncbi:Ran-binding protein 10 [Entomophthora muscae]|uniref:Ran-binding protein 10 n=1 Tax=Entomophthora muscae TaxID=34485 RepID=A0ACC2SBR0_9FUNG|nr:Ran-binding protein 10 [Entomophthora muscae]
MRHSSLPPDARCKPTSPSPAEISYFELMVLALPRDAELSVGLSDSIRLSSTDPSPYNQNSALLDVVRRRLFRNGVDCGPALTADEGDIIGCTVKTSPPSITFSSNGVPCGPISISMDTPLYPTISASQDCRIKYNFGSEELVYGPGAIPLIPSIGHLPKYEDIGQQLPEYE